MFPKAISVLNPGKQYAYLFGQRTLNLIKELNGKLGNQHQDLLKKRYNDPIKKYREDTKLIRLNEWKAVGPNEDIKCRHVEITGPTSDAKMMINALNSEANCYMTDIEDSMSPSWENVQKAHHHLNQAMNGTLSFMKGAKHYTLNQNLVPVLWTRLRGLHLKEEGIQIDNNVTPATFVDFATYMVNNAELLVNNEAHTKGGIYFYIPKIQTYEEALLINEMFKIGEDFMGINRGTIRTTLLIETYPAIFQTEEIIYALRDYICGLNCGRWDYLFSMIKSNMDFNIPDRSLLTMDKPFLSAYIERIVQSCHRRGIHAMGGMSAFIPTGKDDQKIVEKIVKDKELEIKLGCDGAWVAHPGLIGTVKTLFENKLEGRDNQYNIVPERRIEDTEFLDIPDEMLQNKCFTQKEFVNNLNVSLQYLAGWLYGNGAVALNGLMEDMATCEISLYQVKQWVHNKVYIFQTDGAASVEFQVNEDVLRYHLKQEKEKLLRGENLQVEYAKDYLEQSEKCILEYVLNLDKHFLPDVAYEHLNKN